MFSKNNAINLSFVLLDFYKELGMSEDELAVILMIDHLEKDTSSLITNDLLALKMTMPIEKIDNTMTSLLIKRYIVFELENGKASISIDPLKAILFEKFEKSLFTEKEIKNNKEITIIKERVYSFIEGVFERQLTPIEINQIESWILDGISEDIIINSVKDAKNLNKLNIRYIDKIILKKIKTEDNVGNEIK